MVKIKIKIKIKNIKMSNEQKDQVLEIINFLYNGEYKTLSAHQLLLAKEMIQLLDIEDNERIVKFVNNKIEEITHLVEQENFEFGTFRIREPGIYKLLENISFSPNSDDNYFPTTEQNSLYPKENGYILGFFAAITVECNDVVIDLNGKLIEYSKIFNLRQRFGSIIELGSSPFIPKTGPADFGSNFSNCNNVTIKNGTLGQSPHHGIHGNFAKNIRIENLHITKFEVAGISLNGSKNVDISNCKIYNNSRVEVLAFYSQAKFCLSTLKNTCETLPDSIINIAGKDVTGETILNELIDEIKACETNNNYHGLFKNITGLYDGNVYGIVLNSVGPVVNGFKLNRDPDSINNNHTIKNVTIEDLLSDGKESSVIGMSSTSDYGASVCKGFAGDVFDFKMATNKDGQYIGNPLSNAQLFINKFATKKGSCNIPNIIYDWVSGRQSIDDFVKENNLYWVHGLDSMAHVMKGNIGFFITQGKNIGLSNVSISKIGNVGISVGSDSSQSIGLALVTCENIRMNKVKSDSNIHSKFGNSFGQLSL